MIKLNYVVIATVDLEGFGDETTSFSERKRCQVPRLQLNRTSSGVTPMSFRQAPDFGSDLEIAGEMAEPCRTTLEFIKHRTSRSGWISDAEFMDQL